MKLIPKKTQKTTSSWCRKLIFIPISKMIWFLGGRNR